ncbi:Protease 2 [Glycine max]|nr:Protease 2 [Glycine max]KAH1231296.1 Protease 2 [Glycine max]KAH1231297.1 Protease 2 [Glycine max]
MDPSTQSQSPPPPVAKKVEHAMEMFGDVRIGNYYWLRDDSRTDPEVLSYLHEENAYTDSIMSGANPIFLILFRFHRHFSFFSLLNFICSYENTIRMSMRLISDNQKVPYVHDIMPTGPEAPPEHVILDVNVKAQHHQYCTNTTVLVALRSAQITSW